MFKSGIMSEVDYMGVGGVGALGPGLIFANRPVAPGGVIAGGQNLAKIMEQKGSISAVVKATTTREVLAGIKEGEPKLDITGSVAKGFQAAKNFIEALPI